MIFLRLFLVAIVTGAIIISGALHGKYTGRWVPLPALDEPISRLERIPKNAGNWVGTDTPLDKDELASARIEGHVSRLFKNKDKGEETTVLIVCGRPGPISVHTPDICYRGAGFEPIGEPERTTIVSEDGAERSMWVLRFRKPGQVTSRELEVHWAWTTGNGKLEAPSNSRISYATATALYKIYVVRERIAGSPIKKTDGDLIPLIVPEIETALSKPAPTKS